MKDAWNATGLNRPHLQTEMKNFSLRKRHWFLSRSTHGYWSSLVLGKGLLEWNFWGPNHDYHQKPLKSLHLNLLIRKHLKLPGKFSSNMHMPDLSADVTRQYFWPQDGARSNQGKLPHRVLLTPSAGPEANPSCTVPGREARGIACYYNRYLITQLTPLPGIDLLPVLGKC